jgi:ASC-1-like (ASCH) protein
MLEHEKVSAISRTDESHDDLLAAIRDVYDEEKEALGVLALELRIVSDEPR